jgi:RNA polymerase sigma-70 factor (ECF subfamily)
MPRLLDYLRPEKAVSQEKEKVDQRLQDFADRYRNYFHRVFAYIYGRVQNASLAEDLASEVFERAYLKADTLRNHEAFGTWLFTIARNVVSSHGRRRAREQTDTNSEILSTLPSTTASVESQVLQREEIACVIDYVRRLSQREQEIIGLKFDAALANQQIARIVGTSEGNVRVILFRALRKLRDMMAKDEAEQP